MPRFYNNKQEKENFLRQYKDVYRALGYTTDEQIEEIIKQQVEADYIDDEAYDRAIRRKDQFLDLSYNSEEMIKRYSYFDVNTKYYTERISRAMRRPETSVENIEYNEFLATRLQTREGAIQVLQEAVTLLSQITPKILEDSKTDDKVFEKYYNGLMLGFVAGSLLDGVKAFRDDPDGKEKFPEDVVTLLEGNKAFFESCENLERESSMYADPLHHVIPIEFGIAELGGAYVLTGDQKYNDLGTARHEVLGIGKEKRVEKKAEEMTAEEVKKMAAEKAKKEEKEKAVKKARENLEGYFQNIQQRMDDERKNYVKATYSFATGVKKDGVLCKGINSVSFHDPNGSEKKREVMRKNKKWVNDNTEKVLKKARAFNEINFWAAADNVLEELEKGNMRFHTNPNYEKMRNAMEAIKNIAGKSSNIGGLGKETRRELSLEMKNLEEAAAQYLSVKYDDDREYSGLALKRIDAARLCCAFVGDSKRKLLLAECNDLKTELGNKQMENACKEATRYKKEYEEKRDLDSFAKAFAHNRLVSHMKSGKVKMSEKETFIQKRIDAVMLVAKESTELQNAIKKGNFQESKNVTNQEFGKAKAAKELKKQQDIAAKKTEQSKGKEGEVKQEAVKEAAVKTAAIQNRILG